MNCSVSRHYEIRNCYCSSSDDDDADDAHDRENYETNNSSKSFENNCESNHEILIYCDYESDFVNRRNMTNGCNSANDWSYENNDVCHGEELGNDFENVNDFDTW